MKRSSISYLRQFPRRRSNSRHHIHLAQLLSSFSLLAMGMLCTLTAAAQYNFTLIADLANAAIEPEAQPYMSGTVVGFTGQQPADIITVDLSGEPVTLLQAGGEIPNTDSSTFSSIRLSSLDGGNYAFAGSDESFQQGIYAKTSNGTVALAGPGSALERPSGDVALDGESAAFITGPLNLGPRTELHALRNGVISRVAGQETPVPGGALGETFRTFYGVDMSGGTIAFSADGTSGTQGIYLDPGKGLDIQKLVNTFDIAPGGNQPSPYLVLIASPGPAIDGQDVLFFAEIADGRESLLLSLGFNPPEIIVEKGLGSGTTLPGGNERVDRMTAMSLSDGEVAFVARDEDRVAAALYATNFGDLQRIIGSGEMLDGRTIDVVEGSPEMRSLDTIALGVLFQGDVFAVYRTDLDINVGHSGAWFYPVTSGQGQFVEVVPELAFMFVSWFTYTDGASENPDQQHWYTAQGNYSGNEAELILFETTGGKFDGPQEVDTLPVGAVTLSFSDCRQGLMTYGFDDDERAGEFPLRRVIPGSADVCEERSEIAPQAVDINDGMDGSWFQSDQIGQGFFIDTYPQPEGGNLIFVSWFTFGDATASGQRWLTAQGGFAGSRAEIDVFETTGGRFNDPQVPGTVKVGTMTLDFTDCSNATMTYSLTDSAVEGDMPITRVIPSAKALCEELD